MAAIARVARLEKCGTRRCRPEDCRRRFVGALIDAGEEVPHDARPCPTCGATHAIELEVVVVEAGPQPEQRPAASNNGDR